MDALFRFLDPTLALTFLVPLALAGAATALRLACSICTVRPLEFWSSMAVVIVSAAANLALRILMHANGYEMGLGPQVLLALLLTALIVAISVRINVFSAMAVTITQVFLFGLMYLGFNAFSLAMLA